MPSLTSALDGVGGHHHTLATLPLGKRPGTHCTGGWTGVENLSPSGPRIRSLYRPDHSKSLY
jgi:hypothetical protein